MDTHVPGRQLFLGRFTLKYNIYNLRHVRYSGFFIVLVRRFLLKHLARRQMSGLQLTPYMPRVGMVMELDLEAQKRSFASGRRRSHPVT